MRDFENLHDIAMRNPAKVLEIRGYRTSDPSYQEDLNKLRVAVNLVFNNGYFRRKTAEKQRYFREHLMAGGHQGRLARITNPPEELLEMRLDQYPYTEVSMDEHAINEATFILAYSNNVRSPSESFTNADLLSDDIQKSCNFVNMKIGDFDLYRLFYYLSGIPEKSDISNYAITYTGGGFKLTLEYLPPEMSIANQKFGISIADYNHFAERTRWKTLELNKPGLLYRSARNKLVLSFSELLRSFAKSAQILNHNIYHQHDFVNIYVESSKLIQVFDNYCDNTGLKIDDVMILMPTQVLTFYHKNKIIYDAVSRQLNKSQKITAKAILRSQGFEEL